MIVQPAERLNSVKEYYFVKKLEELKQLRNQGCDIINFGIGSPDMDPSEDTVKSLEETAKQSGVHGYQPYRGLPELRERMAEFYRNFFDVSPDPESEILPLMGSKEGIMHLGMAFLNPGDEVLAPDPGYPTYTSVANLMQASVKYYDLKEENNWYPDLEQLAKEDLSGVKLMWINYPHMPTGAPPDPAKMQELVDFAREHQILLCHDNPYSLVLNERPVSILSCDGAREVAVELNSLSKSHNMAGWRVGMLAGREDYIQTVMKVKSNMDSGMFLGIQRAAIQALQNPFSWHQERNEVYRKRREWVFKILDLLDFSYSTEQAGMFVWASPRNPLPEGEDIPAFIDRILYRYSVFFTPGNIFGKNGEGYLRVSLCVPEERIKEAFERLKSST